MSITELFSSFDSYAARLQRPYIIAEAGVNHEGSMDTARHLIEAAKDGGADAIKFQTYKANTLASRDSPAYWDTTKEPTLSQHELFSRYDKFWKDEMTVLKEHCDRVGIEFMSTPFDIESAHFLNELMPVYKISSSDLTNKPFIEEICGFRKPIILSTGGSELWEIQRAVSWIETKGNPLALLHCVLNYPTDDFNANLGMIVGLRRAFPHLMIGYSDHTLPKQMRVCEVATLLGAVVIEKHFTHDKSLSGNDHYHAMDKDDLKAFRSNLDDTFALIGSFSVTALVDEAPAQRHARRSLVAAKSIPAGKTINLSDLTFKRPGHGISPALIDDIVGRKSIQPIAEDTVLQWRMFD